MTRRCQSCVRLFVGDVCPSCGFDHVIHVAVSEAERKGDVRPTAPDNRGIRRAAQCACGAAIPPGKGNRLWCADCKPSRRGVRRQVQCQGPRCGQPIPRAQGARRYCSHSCSLDARRALWAERKVPRPVGGPSGPIGLNESRPGSGRGTPHPKGAA